MVFALLLLSAAANWVPMRWTAADPASLAILKGTPVNCLLLEKSAINPKIVEAATQAGLATLAVMEPGATDEQTHTCRAENGRYRPGGRFPGCRDRAASQDCRRFGFGSD